MKKYYVEFVFDSDIQEQLPEQFFAQSKWKNSIEECLEWATNLFHFFFDNFDYQAFTDCLGMCLMSSEFNENENDEYGDIEQVDLLIYDYHYGKVVRPKDKHVEKLPF